ncbi:MAG TPA: hypothetical protein PKE39_09775 [Ignavibacteria bacterium]|mgnify:CR=1 FL=1|nr:hypothetical protein [Ignavibacteria bacterium]HMQ99300.1 hypothetical protein [Ignavibacteria bacterium]
MDNIYEYNGIKYKLKKPDLGVLHKASPLLIKYRELIYKYSAGIDSSQLLCAENEVIILKEAIEEAEAEIPVNEESLNKLKQKLIEAEKLLNAPPISQLRKHLAEIDSLALFEIITDAEFISGLFSDILVSAEGARVKFDKNSFSEIDSIEFIKNVITDFFLSVQLPAVK